MALILMNLTIFCEIFKHLERQLAHLQEGNRRFSIDPFFFFRP